MYDIFTPIAEVSGDITSEQAWSLRRNVLGIINRI